MDHFPLGERTTLMYFVGSVRLREDGTDADPEYSGGARQVRGSLVVPHEDSEAFPSKNCCWKPAAMPSRLVRFDRTVRDGCRTFAQCRV